MKAQFKSALYLSLLLLLCVVSKADLANRFTSVTFWDIKPAKS